MTSIYAQKITVGHPVVHPMNNSTALIGVVKSGQLGLKGRSIPHMELLLFYKISEKISLFSTSMKHARK
jgi:hypothetical protein